jgi:uncharacterized membrane protein
VAVPALSLDDMFDDAFTAIARDGAGLVEVAGRVQKALASLAGAGDAAMRDVAKRQARIALSRAHRELRIPEDLEVVRRLASFADDR